MDSSALPDRFPAASPALTTTVRRCAPHAPGHGERSADGGEQATRPDQQQDRGLTSPQPQEVLRADDVLVVIGSAQGLEQLEAMLTGRS